MWDKIAALISKDPILSVIIILAGTFTIWLYKEFKAMNNETLLKKLDLVNKKMNKQNIISIDV